MGQGVEHDKVMYDSLETHGGDAYPRLSEFVGIGFPLVAKHIGLRGNDQSGWKIT